MKPDQKGITPIFILAGAAVVGILALIFLVSPFSDYSKVPTPSPTPSSSPAQPTIDVRKEPGCQVRDLSGCDEEAEWFEWKDDGVY